MNEGRQLSLLPDLRDFCRVCGGVVTFDHAIIPTHYTEVYAIAGGDAINTLLSSAILDTAAAYCMLRASPVP